MTFVEKNINYIKRSKKKMTIERIRIKNDTQNKVYSWMKHEVEKKNWTKGQKN